MDAERSPRIRAPFELRSGHVVGFDRSKFGNFGSWRVVFPETCGYIHMKPAACMLAGSPSVWTRMSPFEAVSP